MEGTFLAAKLEEIHGSSTHTIGQSCTSSALTKDMYITRPTPMPCTKTMGVRIRASSLLGMRSQ